jgi:hypothetical protein
VPLFSAGWKCFEAAADGTAMPLPVVKIMSNVGDCPGGCDYSEAVGIGLSNAAFRAARDGFRVKLSAS